VFGFVVLARLTDKIIKMNLLFYTIAQTMCYIYDHQIIMFLRVDYTGPTGPTGPVGPANPGSPIAPRIP
jgi:hypothetical protein